MSDLYRLVYASRNLLKGSQAEEEAAVAQILETSRRNNARVEVTGVLLFNGGAFAQVLEGPRRAVESTFERIQRDERHGDVTVLQCGPVESRSFAGWSMGFAGRSVRGQALWSSLAAESGFDLSRLDGDAVFAMLHSLVLDDEGVIVANDRPIIERPDVDGLLHQTVPELDVARIRAELPRPGQALRSRHAGADGPAIDTVQSDQPIERGIAGSPSAVAMAVLKQALATERQRTTDLRNTLDAMEIKLAAGQEHTDHLLRERDLWARRAQLLAAALGQEASTISGASGPTMTAGSSTDVPSAEEFARLRSA